MLIDPDILERTEDQAAARRRWFSGPRRRTHRSLLNKIIVWMFGPLFLLWSIGLVITYFIAQNIANAPYDRTLSDHLRMLRHEVERQAILNGLRLPPSAITILQGDTEHIIRWEIRDANGHSLGGNSDIPLPDNWTYDEDRIQLRNDTYQGQSIRVAYLWGGRDITGMPFLTVVAQSNEMRATLQQEILTGMLTPQLIVLPLAALLAGLGLTQGLEPLSILQERIRARRANDTSPISAELAPAEIVPLIAAMNSLLARLAAASDGQRRFVSNAAHQLKTPLAGMRTQAELALREDSTEKKHDSLRQLVRGSERATRLVNQLLTLARAESAEARTRLGAEEIDLNSLAATQTTHWVENAIGRHIDLGLEQSPQPALINGDRLMLTELISNLIENAIVYTPEGGSVTVRIGGDALSAYLEVRDSGPGIPLDEQQHVFDRFYRVLGSGRDGSGLGLSIVKEIADLHQASAAFMPVTQGTCIRITFSRIEAMRRDYA